MKRIALFFVACLPFLFSCMHEAEADSKQALKIGMIVMSGEITDTSSVVQVRINDGYELLDTDLFDDGDALRDGVMPGYATTIYFQYTNIDTKKTKQTERIKVTAEKDYIARIKLTNLDSNSTYYVTAYYQLPDGSFKEGTLITFQTLPGKSISEKIRFHVVTGMNYDKFFGNDGPKSYKGEDRDQGYPALDQMINLRANFVVYTGDDVYYDKKPKVKTLADMRSKWHRQFMQPNMRRLLSRTPGYWMKDDHDHRTNDSDATGDYFPSHELGLKTFREQTPIYADTDDERPMYRTHRVSKDLQIWLLEGRDFRSPNKMEDGPGKTMWGKAQLAWLKKTLVESDATYKMIISPTPMIGPDDGYKRDNHTNPKGFKHEGDAVKKWATEQKLWDNGTYFVCGDRHWQYHSIDANGAHEFSCGAINDANSRLGRKPGDKNSTDPDATITQPYYQRPASGGFLSVVIEPGEGDKPAALRAEFYDEKGELLYSYEPGKK